MFIYIVTNTINGKMYVGQTTIAVRRRWNQHIQAAKGSQPRCRALYAAMRKYGAKSFVVESVPMPIGASLDDLNLAERQMIVRMGSLCPSGYNLKSGGDGGGSHSAETKAKLGNLRRGKPSGMKGRKHTPEAIAKMRAAKIGKRMSAEARANMSRAGKGKTLTREHADRIGDALRGRPIAEWRAAKMHAACKGKPLSSEHKAKIIKALTGRPCSLKTRAKMSAASTGRRLSYESREKISAFAKARPRVGKFWIPLKGAL